MDITDGTTHSLSVTSGLAPDHVANAASGNGHGRDDYSSVATFYQDAAGVDAAEKG